MDDTRLYNELFKPVIEEFGPLDPATLTSIIGFDAGGPVSLCTVGRSQRRQFVTYVTCELALRDDQQVSEIGRYELLVTCDDEDWARSILTNVGQMTIEVAFGNGHTLDIGPWVEAGDSIQGLLFEQFSELRLERNEYAIFRVHGVSRPELDLARTSGTDVVLGDRRRSGVYPRTALHVGA